MTMSKKFSGWIIPWEVVRYSGKYYLLDGPKLEPSPSPGGTSTARIEQDDSGIVVSIHPDYLETIDNWHRLGEGFIEVTLQVDEAMPDKLETALTQRDRVVSWAGNYNKKLGDYLSSLPIE